VPRRRAQRLERVLGAPALFATAYGNVGSSIYYALGLTAAYARGPTPVVFIIVGLICAMRPPLIRRERSVPRRLLDLRAPHLQREEANRRGSEIIVIGATRKSERMRQGIFGSTVDYVLKHAPCRVMVVSASAPPA